MLATWRREPGEAQEMIDSLCRHSGERARMQVEEIAPAVSAGSKPLTIGRIAIAVFLGNVLMAVIVGGLWYMTTHP